MRFSFFFFLLFVFLTSKESKGQYYTIPDPVFAQWLNDEFPFCMSGNQLDTTCSILSTYSYLVINANQWGNPAYANLTNLDGLQYFTDLIGVSIQNTQLETFPENSSPIVVLQLSNNNLLYLDTLPQTLTELYISNNPNLTAIPELPLGLTLFHRNFTPQLPVETYIPPTLEIYSANNCNLPQFPPISNIYSIFVNNNQISTLPDFSNHICSSLSFENNQISNMQTMPYECYFLNISHNPITQIPNFPINLTYFLADSCNIQCFPFFPGTIDTSASSFNIDNNPIVCIPNYISAMDAHPWLLNMPICFPNNTLGCPAMYGVLGEVRQDYAPMCMFDNADTGVVNIPISLMDGSTTVLTTTTFSNGNYQLLTNNLGNFEVVIDTLSKPYIVSCSNPGVSSSVSLSTTDTVHTNVDFLIECPPNSDPGIKTIVKEGLVFPSLEHNLFVLAGELSEYYGLNCNHHGGGVIKVVVDGPIDTISIPTTAVPATVVGDTITYNITDFSDLTFTWWELWAKIKMDTTATIGDSVCVTATLIPDSLDYQISNNTFTYCYSVSNSYDPNMKEVFPTHVELGYMDWLYYTIHFQNTGNAPAINIRLEDTLSSDLDLSSIEFLGASHNHQAVASDTKLNVYFNNIWLPDSISDPQGSKGFFQFRIKPNTGTPQSSGIQNKVYIFFDFNEPIITNTAITYFGTDVGLDAHEKTTISLYPNPNSGSFNLKFEDNSERIVKIFNSDGRVIYSVISNDVILHIDLLDQISSGLYILKVLEEDGLTTIPFIIK